MSTNPNSPVLFNFNGIAVRVIDNESGIWFVAADVCRVLELGNVSQSVSRLDEEERGIISNDTPSGEQKMVVINESGLYSLVLGSRKPEARTFKKWVTSEVLPSIRKTGAYALAERIPTNRTPQNFVEALRLAADAEEQRLKLEIELAAAQPKLATHALLMSSDALFTFREVSEQLGSPLWGSQRLIDKLLLEKVIYRDSRKAIHAYRPFVEAGYFKAIETPVYNSMVDTKIIRSQLKVTPRGAAWIAMKLGLTIPLQLQ